ncbi:MAG: hypothetical protein IID49_14015 [Proteobacteria bacterium]|nr:hypothetical protein [Pseudomonadota bacterium]
MWAPSQGIELKQKLYQRREIARGTTPCARRGGIMAGYVGWVVTAHRSTLAHGTMVGSENPPYLLVKARDNKLAIRRDWPEGEDRAKGAFAIARGLAEIVSKAKRAA